MKYFKLTCTAYLKADIHFNESFETLSKLISFSMCQDDALKKAHNEFKAYTDYCYGGFSPREEGKIYKKGQIYTFEIRSIDEVFLSKLAILLEQNSNNPHLRIVETTQQYQKSFFITQLYTLTPAIVSSAKDAQGKALYWTMERDGDIMKLQTQLHENLLSKYEAFYGEKLQAPINFIQLLELKNHKPQTIKLHQNNKPYRLFGNKFAIVPNEDEISQKLAFLALAIGLGEKSSFGAGFCSAKGIKQ